MFSLPASVRRCKGCSGRMAALHAHSCIAQWYALLCKYSESTFRSHSACSAERLIPVKTGTRKQGSALRDSALPPK